MSVDKLFKLGEKLFDKYFVKESSLTKVAEKLADKYLVKNAQTDQTLNRPPKIESADDIWGKQERQADNKEIDISSLNPDQIRLIQMGVFGPDSGEADGIYGPKTKARINLYEKYNNLPQSRPGKINFYTYNRFVSGLGPSAGKGPKSKPNLDSEKKIHQDMNTMMNNYVIAMNSKGKRITDSEIYDLKNRLAEFEDVSKIMIEGNPTQDWEELKAIYRRKAPEMKREILAANNEG